MGRRALRKIASTLDLTGYLLEPRDLPRPLTARELFGRTAPLEVEVGSGKGLFLATASQSHPERDFLGVEISRKYARFSAARLAKRELTNGKIICGDAIRIFHEWLPDESASAVHIYFPDPWWKKRHKKRRVMKEAFIQDVERALEAGGALHFWTDVEEYFQTTLALIASASHLEGPLAAAELPAVQDTDYRTNFERRMRLQDLPVFRAEFRKTI